ncbi:hypothetical protein BBP40_012506 [Aspergillus hancockii]|nr:hypothetical protein BBP40_012506 [Aspergillus hancockii]
MIEGRASMRHVYGMCSLAARFSMNSVFRDISPCSRGNIYASEAVRLSHQCTDTPDLESIQALLLLGYFFSGEGDPQRRHIYVGLARLHTEALSLWGCPMQSSIVDLEEYRRTRLSVRIATHWSASDMSMEPEDACRSSEIRPEVDDVLFHTLTSADLMQTSQLTPANRCDMWAHMAQTLDIFTKISGLLRQLSRGALSLDDYCQEAPLLEDRLDRWNKELPKHLTYSVDNIMFFKEKHLSRTFLAMHIGYHHFRQMLFFPLLEAGMGQESQDATTDKRKTVQCNESATTISEILQYAISLEDCELDYFIYGHIAVVSSCVHLHSLLFSDDALQLSMARQRLVLNFKFLMRLKLYWPIIDSSVSRLRTFQNFCRDSLSDPFVIDNWMARFLTEHSSTLAERQSLPEPSGVGAGWASMHPTDNSEKLHDIGSNVNTVHSSEPPTLEEPQARESGVAWEDLSYLLNDQNMNSKTLANNALDWLLKG